MVDPSTSSWIDVEESNRAFHRLRTLVAAALLAFFLLAAVWAVYRYATGNLAGQSQLFLIVGAGLALLLAVRASWNLGSPVVAIMIQGGTIFVKRGNHRVQKMDILVGPEHPSFDLVIRAPGAALFAEGRETYWFDPRVGSGGFSISKPAKDAILTAVGQLGLHPEIARYDEYGAADGQRIRFVPRDNLAGP